MKIAHVSPAFHPAHIYGGPTYSAFRLCGALAESGSEVRVLTTDANGLYRTLEVDTSTELELRQHLRVRYCHRVAMHSVSPVLLRLLPSVVKWADVVHLTGVYNFTTFPTLFACRSSGKPLVWSPRGAFQRWEGSTRIGAKGAWESACRIVAPKRFALHVTSDDEARQSIFRLPGADPVVIPNGVDLPLAHVKQPSAVLRMLYLGRLHPIKGIENLVDACGKLAADQHLPWMLTIAGDGDSDYRALLQRRVSELNLEKKIRFVGDVRDDLKVSLFHTADVVVVPSHSENFGIVVAEALAHGVPVIASKGTPWARLEVTGCGLWVANDANSLADAIRRMAVLPRVELGVRARAWIEADFSWRHVAQRTLELYSALTLLPKNA